ncbi:MAG: hypothetical protein JXQ29_17085 [Planctomycetes bacterium]|nr:hypothetical protein [Planctomycetota bacterium]
MALDIQTGDLIVGRSSSVYRLARDGSAVTTLGTGFNFRYGDMAQELLTGDIYVPTCCGWLTPGQSLYVLRAGTSTASIFLADTGLAGAYGPNMDRASATNPRIVTGSHIYASSYPNSGGMWYIDLATKQLTKLASFQLATVSDTTILGSREVQPVRTAPGVYELRFSIPTEGGFPYVAAISLTDVQPALPLPDGRRIPLIIDTFAVASLNGWLAPFLTGNLGSLDPLGRARGKLDLRSVYPAVKGIRLWVLLATLHPRAPLGIATIADPKVLVID